MSFFFYFAVKYTSTHFHSRLCEVHCEKCRCEYFYELRRSGTGSDSAAYVLSSKNASDGSHKNAERAAAKHLESEAELVPCPRCHWVNEDLIRGYRNSCYRGWIEIAIGAAVLGLGLSALEIPLIWNNGIDKTNELFFWVVVWPLFLAAVAGSFIASVLWLRRRIDPNQNYPDLSRLPSGVPQSLFLDPLTNLLVPTGEVPPDPLDQSSFRFYADRHVLPDACCVCLRDNDGRHGHWLNVFKGWDLWIPVCATCARRKAIYRIGIGIAIVSLIVTVSVTAAVRVKLSETAFWIAAGASALIAVMFAGAVTPLLFRPAWVTSKDALRGIFRLSFKNRDFMHRIVDSSPSLEFPVYELDHR